MDERELAQLFEAAADDAPPSRFGHADVVAASRRATQRRRAGIAAGSVFAVAVLAGGVALGDGLFTSRDTAEQATAGSAAENDQQVPGGGQADSAPQRRQPSELSAPGEAAPPGKTVPWPGLGDGAARAGCGEADGELARALATELTAADATAAGPVPEACPPGARAVAVPVVDGARVGSIYLVLGPVDAALAAASTGQPVEREQDGASGYQRRTASGRLLLVLSVPAVDGEQPPFAADAAALAERIGSKF